VVHGPEGVGGVGLERVGGEDGDAGLDAGAGRPLGTDPRDGLTPGPGPPPPAPAARPAAACRHADDWTATSMSDATATAQSTRTVANERRDGKQACMAMSGRWCGGGPDLRSCVRA